MEKEKFRLSVLNIVLICVIFSLLLILVVGIILLVNSFSHPIKDLPKLKVTEGRTSTLYVRTTTEYTTTTTTTTTKYIPSQSPYYKYNIDDILSNELFTKQTLSREEVDVLVDDTIAFLNSLYNTADMSIFDTDAVMQGAHEGEIDVLNEKGLKYYIIYNSEELVNKTMTTKGKNYLTSSEVNNKKVFLRDTRNKIYYRLEKQNDYFNFVIVSKTNSISSEHIESEVRFYYSNYKDMGYSNPVYEKVDLKFSFVDGRWKIEEFVFPYKG